eukprot:TRINITY_DN22701_c0_g1_i2.p2 TRINITY_DN22701_c0_g1~~TRINITY_DN22701_c0_g1_i2.p2  ORF type:complete len:103 (+),score=1.13 TRINITY_DN22701_c0_g1_i2:770-1078(+)
MLYGKMLETCTVVTILGVILSTVPGGTMRNNRRVDAAAKVARRLSALPLTTSQKAHVVAATSAVRGISTPPTSKHSGRQLRKTSGDLIAGGTAHRGVQGPHD